MLTAQEACGTRGRYDLHQGMRAATVGVG